MLHRISTQIGQTERDGVTGRVSQEVVKYFAAASLTIPDDITPPYWGGCLMAWAAIQDGIVPPVGAAEPFAWMNWGSPLLEPVAGAIVILTEGGGKASREIGIAGRVQNGKVYVIGCHEGAVQSRAVPIERVIMARRPPNAALLAPAPVQDAAQPTVQMPQIIIQAPAAMPAPERPAQEVLPPLPVPVPQPPVIQPEPLAAIPAIAADTPPAPPAVTMEQLQNALSNLLNHVQAEFSTIHDRVDTVERHAVASVEIHSPTQ